MLSLELGDRVRIIRRRAGRTAEKIQDRRVVETARPALKSDYRDRVVGELARRRQQVDSGDGWESHPRPLRRLSPSAAPCRTAWSSAFAMPGPLERIHDATDAPCI